MIGNLPKSWAAMVESDHVLPDRLHGWGRQVYVATKLTTGELPREGGWKPASPGHRGGHAHSASPLLLCGGSWSHRPTCTPICTWKRSFALARMAKNLAGHLARA